MKLIFAIVSNEDASRVQTALTSANFQVTRLATTGGFLMAGDTTFLCGTDNDKVDEVVAIVSEHSKSRTHTIPSAASYGVGMYTTYPVKVPVGGATIFVTDIDRFEKV